MELMETPRVSIHLDLCSSPSDEGLFCGLDSL